MAERSDDRVELITARDQEQLLNVSCTGVAIVTEQAKKRGELVCVTINGLAVKGYVVYSYHRKINFRTGIRFETRNVDMESLRSSVNAFAGGVPLSFTINNC
jgi:hypothetical protein